MEEMEQEDGKDNMTNNGSEESKTKGGGGEKIKTKQERTGDMKTISDTEGTGDKKTRKNKVIKDGTEIENKNETEVMKAEVENADSQAIDQDQSAQQKSVRRRKKRLLAQITQQMDFYFSAANISKDQFMAGLLGRDPYIPLDIFFRFNRIRSLTTDIGLLRTAIVKSSILELSDDGERVRRAIEIIPKEDETACTIYVENIPSQADHDWVRQVFAQYGTIDYISLPRFHRSGRPKGFAFVEFGTPAMADSALEAFGALDCRIPTTSDPACLQSIKGFNEEEGGGGVIGEGNEDVRGDIGEGNGEDIVEKRDGGGGESGIEGIEKACNKRKLSCEKVKEDEIESENIRDSDKSSKCTGELDRNAKTEKKRLLDPNEEKKQEPEHKKKKTRESRSEEKEENPNQDAQEQDENKIEESSDPIEKKKRKRESKSEEYDERNPDPKAEQQQNNDQMETCDPVEKKMKRESQSKDNSDNKIPDENVSKEQRQQQHQVEPMESSTSDSKKKKKKKRKRNKKEKEEEVDSIYLRVMSKADWKRLRNKYLNAQREYMMSLKRELGERKHYHSSRWAADDADWSSGPPHFLRPDESARERGNRYGRKTTNRDFYQGQGSFHGNQDNHCDSNQNTHVNHRDGAYFPKSEEGDGDGDGEGEDEDDYAGGGDSNDGVQFVQGTIIKISFEEPQQDPKKMNEAIREGSDGGVAYVDVKPTERNVYVRFHSKEFAKAYREAGCWSRMEILTGTEEEEYWKYINSCWAQRRNKKNRKTGLQGYGLTEPGKGEPRGRDKLLGKAVRQTHSTKPNSHIVFED
ncbi:hypothetical protein Pmani_016503 [Petrolisthes manimaculis]|uniref:La-related protein 7 n=1 Tax=Petrolisthes manimaculis TaxID=1843537 RepID=A0AAE1PPZ2_9EUCA|nr:hypothetical protein Pmani_016503 [Petrolisthes manimaculis]